MSLKRDTLYNLAGNGIPLMAAAVAIPYLLATLGNEKFGVLTLIWGLIGYFSLFDFGVGRALTYEVSRKLEVEKYNSIDRVIKAGLVITILTGVIGAFIVYFVVAPYSSIWFKISLGEQDDAKFAFAITAIGIIPTTLTSGLRGALEGFKRFVESNINRTILGTLMFLVPALVIWMKLGELPAIALGLVAVRILVCAFSLFQLRKYIYGRFDIRLDDIKPLLNFGVWITVSGIVSPLMVYGDRFFISSAIGAQNLTFYAIPQEGLQRLLIFPTALVAALLPRMAAIGDKNKLKELYLDNIKKIGVSMFFILLVAAIVSRPVLSAWISEDFSQKSKEIVVILCVGLWFNSLAQMPMTLLHSIGRPKLAAISHMIELPLYIAVIMIFTAKFGVVGAAMAWSFRVILDFFVFHWLAKICLK